MDFELPREITDKLAELDAFIEAEIKPLERDHIQFFDHRRENARTDWDDDGRPRTEWRALISEMERRADKAGHLRYGLPKSCGGQAASNLAIAAIREHLAAKGLGLHNDLQDESSIVGNFPIIPALADYGTEEQKPISRASSPEKASSFGLTEPGHGSDATWLETTACDATIGSSTAQALEQPGGPRACQSGFCAPPASRAKPGVTAFIVPTDTPGHNVLYNHWTFNMPSDHAETELINVRVPDSAILQRRRRPRRRAALCAREPRRRRRRARAPHVIAS
jgi:alkylation response protein AidB-like acyl-CoA dehydrogenase